MDTVQDTRWLTHTAADCAQIRMDEEAFAAVAAAREWAKGDGQKMVDEAKAWKRLGGHKTLIASFEYCWQDLVRSVERYGPLAELWLAKSWDRREAYSFEWAIRIPDKENPGWTRTAYNGGFKLHGFGHSDSVQLVDTVGWQIHT